MGRITTRVRISRHSGNLDLLAADALRLRQKADSAPDSTFTFVLRNGAIHDWAMGGVLATPESAAVQHHIHRQLGLQPEQR
ncbi:hypothetical protein [Nocardia aurea]|uniref:hypothetical protein n=1 Tax=Nocardia aurea TaxID=2144174 RepID=UPI000D693691|nr:hypothetical protein [Nocardia aurea]